MSQPSQNVRHSLATRIGFIIGLVVLLAVVFLWSRHNEGNKAGQAGQGNLKKAPVPVTVALVEQRDMPVRIQTIGNVEPISTVTLKPQIDGTVIRINFQEGSFVEKGQLLFTIDTQLVEAALAQTQATVSRDQSLVAQARAGLVKDQSAIQQAEASLKRDLAQLGYAKVQEKRYASLLKQEFVSQDQYDQVVTARKVAESTVASDQSAVQNAKAVVKVDYSTIASAEANVKADQAMVESNRIKLAYGQIRAPFSGRTGSLKIHAGDTVKTGDTELIRLDKLSPISVGFSVAEQELKSVRTKANTQQFPVTVETREDPPTRLSGTVNFLDNTVDTNTGTIRMKATFSNSNRLLWPGQFVDVVLNLAQQTNAVVIPSQALQSGQNGDYVFVVTADNKAEMRPVVVDRIVDQFTVIRSGVRPGEQVVTDGQFQLSNGSPLQIKPPENR